jgi:hypothetical protein
MGSNAAFKQSWQARSSSLTQDSNDRHLLMKVLPRMQLPAIAVHQFLWVRHIFVAAAGVPRP